MQRLGKHTRRLMDCLPRAHSFDREERLKKQEKGGEGLLLVSHPEQSIRLAELMLQGKTTGLTIATTCGASAPAAAPVCVCPSQCSASSLLPAPSQKAAEVGQSNSEWVSGSISC
jgi:hypothetical protein